MKGVRPWIAKMEIQWHTRMKRDRNQLSSQSMGWRVIMLSKVYLVAFWDIYNVREGFTLFWDIFYNTNTRHYILAHSEIYRLPIIRKFSSFWGTVQSGAMQYCTVRYNTVPYGTVPYGTPIWKGGRQSLRRAPLQYRKALVTGRRHVTNTKRASR